ncbi:hypothetical protein PR048_015361 [Dryococelus australis]|uniref:RNA-directed DNA polymerase n=1 Tax=Dryococelus australis TaxID=614101 RepID=A0ABQ9HGR7_9NEOP|nr:hypothetical protein PR048_015361 [Dryococelus australis]
MRTVILKKLHDGHQGITKCRALAKERIWWPRMSLQLKDLVENCCTCAKFRPRKTKQLLPSEFPKRPWQVMGADLLKCKGRWYLIIVIVPDDVRADCGTQFNCSKFKQLAQEYNRLITSSSHYPRSNRFVEAEVKNFKNHLQKNNDPYKMLLLLRAAPLENLVLQNCSWDNFDGHHAAKTLTELPISSNVFISDRQQETPRSYIELNMEISIVTDPSSNLRENKAIKKPKEYLSVVTILKAKLSNNLPFLHVPTQKLIKL